MSSSYSTHKKSTYAKGQERVHTPVDLISNPGLFMQQLLDIIRADTRSLMKWLTEELGRHEYTVHTDNDNYVVGVPKCFGTDKFPQIAMVAHMDTVPRINGVELRQQGPYIYNLNGVLGADDRAGVYSIMDILWTTSYRPLIIFCNYEESGGLGVRHLCYKTKVLDDLLDDVHLLIEIDRQGIGEYVYYSHHIPAQVEHYVEKYGFTEHVGSYSDVATITDAYCVPHVNISAGYWNQHGRAEYLDVTALSATLYKVKLMFGDPSLPKLEVQPKPVAATSSYAGAYDWDEEGFGQWRGYGGTTQSASSNRGAGFQSSSGTTSTSTHSGYKQPKPINDPMQQQWNRDAEAIASEAKDRLLPKDLEDCDLCGETWFAANLEDIGSYLCCPICRDEATEDHLKSFEEAQKLKRGLAGEEIITEIIDADFETEAREVSTSEEEDENSPFYVAPDGTVTGIGAVKLG